MPYEGMKFKRASLRAAGMAQSKPNATSEAPKTTPSSILSHLLALSLGVLCGAFLLSQEAACAHLQVEAPPMPPLHHMNDSLASGAMPLPPLSASATSSSAPLLPSPSSSPDPSPPPRCQFRYTHVSTDGFGGSFNQILNGKVTAALQGLPFCLATPVDLVDENGWHGTDNAWLRKYWDGVPRCPAVASACDVSAEHVHNDWFTPYVWRMWQLFYAEEFVRLRERLTSSPLSKRFAHCAHVRTGDTPESQPSVPVSGVQLHLFGAPHADYEFCKRNTCVLLNVSRDVEFDFVNMLNCEHLYACDSSLSITAKLLSPHNDEYVKVARVDNTRYTQFFSSSWAPRAASGCDVFPVRADEYGVLYEAAGRPRG